MNTRIQIDGAGRVVIPKPLRDELQLEAGDALEIEQTGESITLRPVRGNVPLGKDRGVWVFRSGEVLTAETTNEVLRRIRDERDSANIGKRK